jgi:hypothetical protein
MERPGNASCKTLHQSSNESATRTSLKMYRPSITTKTRGKNLRARCQCFSTKSKILFRIRMCEMQLCRHKQKFGTQYLDLVDQNDITPEKLTKCISIAVTEMHDIQRRMQELHLLAQQECLNSRQKIHRRLYGTDCDPHLSESKKCCNSTRNSAQLLSPDATIGTWFSETAQEDRQDEPVMASACKVTESNVQNSNVVQDNPHAVATAPLEPLDMQDEFVLVCPERS